MLYKCKVRILNNSPFEDEVQSTVEVGLRGMFFLLILLFTFNYSIAQEDNIGTEVVNIVKPYSPTISDAFKVKETPILYDSVSAKKKKVTYNIFSVPVASTFTPAKGKATSLEKTKPIKLFDNYATLGFGNFTNIIAELYSNFEISRTDNFGLYLKHNSSQGGIDDVQLDDKFYNTNLEGNYTSRQKDVTYQVKAGVEHQIFNWYGLNEFFNEEIIPDEVINGIDPKQTYLSGYVGGSLSLEDSYFEKGTATIRYLGDNYSSSEFNISFLPEFSFPISNYTVKVDGEIDYLNGGFDTDYFNSSDINYSFLNAGIAPSFVYVNEDLTLSIGVAGYLSLDSENSNTDFYIYPKVNASYRLVDELLIVYGGVDGGLEQNSYYNFKEDNPFVSPTLYIMPTSQQYNGFAGIKGKLTNTVGYNLRASYGKEDNKALFRTNFYKGMNPDYRGYEYGNSFKIVYDDINTLSIFGELKVELSENFSLGINGTFNSYNTSGEMEAWNIPELEASLFSNFNITNEIYGGLSVFYVGERKDLFVGEVGPNTFPFAETITLDGYVDANVHFGYRFNEQLSFFVKGSNLFGDNYQKWFNYPVQGIQGLFGASYKFDW